MKKIILVIVLLLSGCGATITQQEWVWAEKVCEKNGGLIQLLSSQSFPYNKLFARCKNGAKFTELIQYVRDGTTLEKWIQENSDGNL